jgi:hypothetical protein
MGTPGAVVGDHGPGEICLCLSYYSVYNAKRFRGRNYVPYNWIYTAIVGGGSTLAARPTTVQQQVAMGLWDQVYKPVDHNTNWDWVLRSPTDKAFKPITDVWVDDEWDTLRSRGLRPSSRITAKT